VIKEVFKNNQTKFKQALSHSSRRGNVNIDNISGPSLSMKTKKGAFYLFI